MATVRMTLAQMRKQKPKLNRKKIDATTEADILRHAKEDDNPIWTARDFKRARVVTPPEAVDVRAIRRRQRLSQRAFAMKYGFSPRTVQDWEQGRSRPDRPARLLLAMIDHAPATVERVLRQL
ncbi:MAG TPA: helix-turn-helix domain-containing protein [Alphaproteobacteria bacterium]|nr:helix-turn-helix domain-containing protein [Alphaproteobacteria bacterium]